LQHYCNLPPALDRMDVSLDIPAFLLSAGADPATIMQRLQKDPEIQKEALFLFGEIPLTIEELILAICKYLLLEAT
jgi:hypothetical protein